jgi:peptidoglycan/xylan/chitin deacetylase (PgdA/CDA1 family)
MRRTMRRFVSLALLLAACSGSVEDEATPIADDAPEGDSLEGGDGKADGVTVPRSIALDRDKVVYLTFDDGPSPVHTPRILDVLKRKNVKATFFITGASIAGNEAIIQRTAREGHIVGSHQWQHSIATTSQFRGWVTRERDLLRGLVGAEMPLYFRYPYGAVAAWKEPILREAGYLDGGVGWDIDTLDWDFGPDGKASRSEVPAALRNDFEGWIFGQLERRHGGVMLFHDVQSITASRLEAIIDRLSAAGYRFGELPRVRAFTGEACTDDVDCALTDGFCGPTGLCTTACTRSCGDVAGHPITRCVTAPSEAEGEDIQVCAASCSASCLNGCQPLVAASGATQSVCW